MGDVHNGHDGNKAYVHGAEYETNTFTGYIKTIHDHDVPCAVCLVRQRAVVKMFPGEYGRNFKKNYLLFSQYNQIN